MKDLNKICFILQARVNSSRLPGKMIKPFAGTSLIEIAIDKLKKSTFPNDNIILSVNDPELIDIASRNNIKIYNRSKNSTRNDDVNPFTLTEVLEWWDKLDYEYYMLMNACNPLIEIETLNSFIEDFISTPSDGLFTVVEHKRFFYKSDGSIFQKFHGNEDQKITFNTKFVEPIYSGGPLRGGKLSDIGKNVYIGSFKEKNNPLMTIYPSDQYIDIDYDWEFKTAEQLYINKFKK